MVGGAGVAASAQVSDGGLTVQMRDLGGAHSSCSGEKFVIGELQGVCVRAQKVDQSFSGDAGRCRASESVAGVMDALSMAVASSEAACSRGPITGASSAQ